MPLEFMTGSFGSSRPLHLAKRRVPLFGEIGTSLFFGAVVEPKLFDSFFIPLHLLFAFPKASCPRPRPIFISCDGTALSQCSNPSRVSSPRLSLQKTVNNANSSFYRENTRFEGDLFFILFFIRHSLFLNNILSIIVGLI